MTNATNAPSRLPKAERAQIIAAELRSDAAELDQTVDHWERFHRALPRESLRARIDEARALIGAMRVDAEDLERFAALAADAPGDPS